MVGCFLREERMNREEFEETKECIGDILFLFIIGALVIGIGGGFILLIGKGLYEIWF